jgi:type IV pilus assembly protein PilN
LRVGDAEVSVVILINLLPHRELARKRAKDAYNVMLVLAAAVGVLLAGAIYMGYRTAIDLQQSRNAFLTAKNKELDKEIKDVTDLQSEITSLKARQQAVENLQTNRNLPVYLLNDMVRLLPEGMYLNGIKQEGASVLLTGVAQSQGRVSELLRNLSSGNSQWISQPDLIEIKSDQVTLSARDQRHVYSFTVRIRLGRPGEAVAARTKGGA